MSQSEREKALLILMSDESGFIEIIEKAIKDCPKN